MCVDKEKGCGHVYAKLKQEQPYRQKVITSLAVYGIFAVIGGIKGQLGPAFLDLQYICDVGLDEGAWIVTSLYIGYTLGALANGFIYHRCNRNLLFSSSAVCLTIIVAVIPWCTEYGIMVACHTGMGLVVGLIDAAGNAEIIRLWKTESKTILVGLHVIFNLGGVISPTIIAPFLMEITDGAVDTSTTLPDQIATPTEYNANNSLQHSISLFQQTLNSNTSEDNEYETVSKIYIAYSISSLFCLIHALWFVCLYFTEKESENNGDDKQLTIEQPNDRKQPNGHSNDKEYLNSKEPSHEKEHFNVNGYSKAEDARSTPNDKEKSNFHIPRNFQFLGLVVMVIMAALSNAIDFSFSTYLSSFCVEFLHWSKASGSMITSLLFIMVVTGGTLSMFLTKCINSIIYIGFQVILILISLILLLLSINFRFTVGVWLSAPLLGFAKSAIFPLVIAWTNKTFIRVSGRISSAFFVGAMGGSAVNLFMLASVMERLGKIWFCYVLMVESILLILFFITSVFLTQYVKHWKQRETTKSNDMESTGQFIDS